MWWRILLLLVAPYGYALLLSLPPRRSPQVEIERPGVEFAACTGTYTGVFWRKRPRASDAGVRIQVERMSVRGWKRVRGGEFVAETNLPRAEAMRTAVVLERGLKFLRMELGLEPAAALQLRIFNKRRHLEEYARYIGAPEGAGFIDLTRGEVVLAATDPWHTVGNALHLCVHVLLRDRNLPDWLEEGLAESAAALEFDRHLVSWMPLEEESLQGLRGVDLERAVQMPRSRKGRLASRWLVEELRRRGNGDLKRITAKDPAVDLAEARQWFRMHREGRVRSGIADSPNGE